MRLRSGRGAGRRRRLTRRAARHQPGSRSAPAFFEVFGEAAAGPGGTFGDAAVDYTDEIGGHFVGSRGGFVAVYPGFDGLADDFGSGEILAVSQAGDALAGFWIET